MSVKSGLGHQNEGEFVEIFQRKNSVFQFFSSLDHQKGAPAVAGDALNLRVAGVSGHQHHRLRRLRGYNTVDLGDKGTGGVRVPDPRLLQLAAHRQRDPVGPDDHHPVPRLWMMGPRVQTG